jgi:hypothetical protein
MAARRLSPQVWIGDLQQKKTAERLVGTRGRSLWCFDGGLEVVLGNWKLVLLWVF